MTRRAGRTVIAAIVVVALLLGGCSDDRPASRAPTSTSTSAARPRAVTTTTAGWTWPDDDLEWVDLPRSPVGEWPVYNWTWLTDGTGFVQTGAASTVTRDGDSTSAAALYDFDAGAFTELPELPLDGGLAAAGGAWIGDRLVLVGQDCIPVPGPSFGGEPRCPDGRARRRVTAVWERGGATWTVADVPPPHDRFPYGTPDVLGVSDGRLVVQSDGVPGTLGAFDPTTGDWETLPDLPVAHPDQPGTGVSFPGPIPRACVLDGTVIAFVTGVVPNDLTNRWYEYDGRRFRAIDPPADQIEGVVCATTGAFVTRRTGPADTDRELVFSDPGAGVTVPIATFDGQWVSPPTGRQRGGAVTVVSYDDPSDPSGVSFGGRMYLQVATAFGLDPVRAESGIVYELVGRHFVRTNDANGVDPRQGPPQIAAALPAPTAR